MPPAKGGIKAPDIPRRERTHPTIGLPVLGTGKDEGRRCDG